VTLVRAEFPVADPECPQRLWTWATCEIEVPSALAECQGVGDLDGGAGVLVAGQLSERWAVSGGIVRIEKSGAFWDHAQAIRGHIPEGKLMLLDESYIERYITFKGAAVHGLDTYYGRHFFYRAQGGQIYVVTVPPLGRVGAERHGELDLDDYPTLGATCGVLDSIGTRLYDDATIPITLAHKYAAYPLTTAGQVLKMHAEEHLDRAMAA
jgi:hypothetical protein